MEFKFKITPVPLDPASKCEFMMLDECGPVAFKVEASKMNENEVTNERTRYYCTSHAAAVECFLDEWFDGE